MQTGQDDGETEPQAGQGEEPEPAISGEGKVLGNRGKKASEGDHGATNETACGTGSSDVGNCRSCKTVQAFLKHGTDLFLNLTEDCRIGMWGQGAAGWGILVTKWMIKGIGG